MKHNRAKANERKASKSVSRASWGGLEIQLLR